MAIQGQEIFSPKFHIAKYSLSNKFFLFYKNPGKRFARMSGERFGKNGRSRRRTFLGMVLTRIYSQGLKSSISIFKLYLKFDNLNPF